MRKKDVKTKHIDHYRIRTMLVVFLAGFVLCGGSAKAEFIFTEPVNLGFNINTSYDEDGPCISADGLSLYFTRWDHNSNYKLMIARRTDTDSSWSEAVEVEMPIEPGDNFTDPSISADGLSMYLTKHGMGITAEIWVSQRPDIYSAWDEPFKLESIDYSIVTQPHNYPPYIGDPSISPDNLELYFVMNALLSTRGTKRIVSNSATHIWMTRRTSADEPWGTPEFVLSTNKSTFCPCISWDGFTLLFSEGKTALYISRLTAAESYSFENPIKLPEPVNNESDPITAINMDPCLSHDGRELYFVSNGFSFAGGLSHDIWKTTSVPVVDFNSDENIDTNDLLILMDNWKTSERLCDIAPAPWGDNMVDMKDLEVFIEYWEKEKFPVLPNVNVSISDNGELVELELGQKLVVKLESNPSTGYTWELIEDPNSILEQIGEMEFKPYEQGDPPMVGAGGWEIFRFKAISTGQETLELIYRRSWETDVQPLDVFTLMVTVN